MHSLQMLQVYNILIVSDPKKKAPNIKIGSNMWLAEQWLWRLPMQAGSFVPSLTTHYVTNARGLYRYEPVQQRILRIHISAFSLGNVIVCTHPSVSVSLFNLRKILNEWAAWPSAILVLPDSTPNALLNLLQLGGNYAYSKRSNNWTIWSALRPWSVAISCVRFSK